MKSFRAKPVGWANDNYRHYLAAKYGSAGKRYFYRERRMDAGSGNMVVMPAQMDDVERRLVREENKSEKRYEELKELRDVAGELGLDSVQAEAREAMVNEAGRSGLIRHARRENETRHGVRVPKVWYPKMIADAPGFVNFKLYPKVKKGKLLAIDVRGPGSKPGYYRGVITPKSNNFGIFEGEMARRQINRKNKALAYALGDVIAQNAANDQYEARIGNDEIALRNLATSYHTGFSGRDRKFVESADPEEIARLTVETPNERKKVHAMLRDIDSGNPDAFAARDLPPFRMRDMIGKRASAEQLNKLARMKKVQKLRTA